MSKFLSWIPGFFLIAAITVVPVSARAQATSSGGLPPKAKAFLMVSAYGAAGGALLGLASMAFGTSSRAVSQGASLGLYAGILFGTYVIVSHNNRNAKPSYDNSTPYNDGQDDYGDYGDEGDSKSSGGGFFDSGIQRPRSGALVALNEVSAYRSFETKKGSNSLPPFQMTVFSYNF